MRPNVYGGHCSLENNLTRLAIFQQQPFNQEIKFSRQPYINTLSPPATSSAPNHVQHQQSQKFNFEGNCMPPFFNNALTTAHPAHCISTSQKTNKQIFSTKLIATNSPGIFFENAAFNETLHNAHTSSRQLLPSPSLERSVTVNLRNGQNFGQLSYTDRVRECAGVPLMSIASNPRQRPQRRPTATLIGYHVSNNSREISFPNFQPNYAIPHHAHYERPINIARMAIHAEGAPLLLQKASPIPPYWSTLDCHQGHEMPTPINNGLLAVSVYANNKSRLCYQHSAPPILNAQHKESHTLTMNGQNSNSSKQPFTNIDDAKEFNKTCLPRIIKPRKRRKKDRKSANGVFFKFDGEHDSKPTKFAANEIVPCSYALQKNHEASNLLKEIERNPNNTYAKTQYDLEIHQHERNCYCSSCNSLRSIWEYPLRRSFSDASNSSQNETSSSSASSPIMSNAESSASPASLAFISSLRTKTDSESFSPITVDSTRANVVGVIGSNRANSQENSISILSARNCAHEYSRPRDATIAEAATCLSDSNDSGYGDILSGINIAYDLFKHVKSNELEPQTPTLSSMLSSCAAETLLTASINEISRQLLETCINESATASNDLGCCSTFSNCSEVSNDSGFDSAGSLRNHDDVVKFNYVKSNEKALTENGQTMLRTGKDLSLPSLNSNLDLNNNTTNDSKSFNRSYFVCSATLAEQDDHFNQQVVQNCNDLVSRTLPLKYSQRTENIRTSN